MHVFEVGPEGPGRLNYAEEKLHPKIGNYSRTEASAGLESFRGGKRP